jgi:hypothetical protein
MFFIAAATAAAIGWGSCSNDSLPTSPSGPFLFSSIEFGKGMSPTPQTPLAHAQKVNLHYTIAYTLDPGNAKIRDSLRLFVNVYADLNDTTIVGIGAFPDRSLTLPANSGILTDSIPFIVPANVTYVDVEAFMDTLPLNNDIINYTSHYWPVP